MLTLTIATGRAIKPTTSTTLTTIASQHVTSTNLETVYTSTALSLGTEALSWAAPSVRQLD